ncbi:O-antigen ligase family protein [uncultured Kordia sp.]|uniref:O-antigen ligase family protein n=1 Tax=uncultured Kordia sp. TaxID=507699 RepID=UPI002611B4DD|nr:O-antigen ligase family protein [uncultured Kordia sp.]
MKTKKAANTTPSEDTNVTIAKILFVLYLLTGLMPLLGAMDYDAPEWLYVSVLNLISLGFIYKNRDEFEVFSFPKHVQRYFLLFIGFFAIGCLSMLTAINVSESLVHLARLIAILVALYCLYVFVKQNPRSFFEFTCRIATLLVIYFSWRSVRYFLGNASSPRINDFINDFQHHFSSVNIYTAFLIVQLPFVLYAFLYFKKVWKYIASVAIFMTMLALFFSGSRTAVLSLVIVMTLLVGFIIYGIVRHKIALRKEAVVLFLMPIVAIILVLNVNRVDKMSMNSLTTLFQPKLIDFYEGDIAVKRNIDNVKELLPNTGTITVDKSSVSGRSSLWNLAFIKFQENPILGVGYGNYKAVGKKEHYINLTTDKGNFKNPRRAHNDFLEKLAETGVIGFLLYVSLFLFPLWLFFKLIRNEKDFGKQLLYFTIFLSALAYTFDALLNFPLERAPIQLYFLLAVIFILTFTQKEGETIISKRSVILFGIIFFVSFASVASNYLVLKSYRLQRAMRQDLSGKTLFTDEKLNNSYQSIKKQWSNYPELSYVGTVNNVYLANYAIKAKKYEEALEILNKSQDYNKDAFLVKAFKAEIFYNVYDNMDSAAYYSEAIFDGYPAFKTNYRLLKGIYNKQKDTANLSRIMNRYTKLNWVDVNEWKVKANTMYNRTKNSELMLKVLDTGLVYNTNSNTLLKAKKEVLNKLKFKSYLSSAEVKQKHQVAFNFFSQQKYEEARKIFQEILKTNPKDYLSVQNIGIIDLVKKNYEKAIKNLSVVIDAGAFSDGKAEYSRGYCYEQLGQMEKAKADYILSRAKNYPQAMSLPESKYK